MKRALTADQVVARLRSRFRAALTAEQVVARLRDIVAQAGSQLGAAEQLGVAPSHLNTMLAGKCRPGRKVLRALKLVREDVYYEEAPK